MRQRFGDTSKTNDGSRAIPRLRRGPETPGFSPGSGFICLIGMLPSGLQSPDPVFKAFTVVNLAIFSAVVVQVLRYR